MIVPNHHGTEEAPQSFSDSAGTEPVEDATFCPSLIASRFKGIAIFAPMPATEFQLGIQAREAIARTTFASVDCSTDGRASASPPEGGGAGLCINGLRKQRLFVAEHPARGWE